MSEQLRRYAEAAEGVVAATGQREAAADRCDATPDAVTAAAPAARRSRRRRWPAVAVAACLALVAGLVVVQVTDGDEPRDVTAGPDRTPTAPAPEGWSTFPEAPIAGRYGAIAVATDAELIVWGGRNHDGLLSDGAAYSFRDGTWRVLAESPLGPRARSIAVWTGDEVLIWGGLDVDTPAANGDSALGTTPFDRAAYDPSTDTWRALAEAPFGAVLSRTGAVWTGSELVLVDVVGPAGADLASNSFAYDPAADRWRVLGLRPSPPEGIVSAVRSVAVWTGTEVLAVSIADGHDVWVDRLDVTTGEWGDRITTQAAGLDTGPDGVAWAGDRLVIAGHYAPGAIVDPVTGEASPLAPSNSDLRHPAVAFDDILVVGDRWLDVTTATWHDTGEVPGPFRAGAVAVGHEGSYYVWGGDACGQAARCAELVDPGIGLRWTPPSAATPATEGWSTIPEAPIEGRVDPSAGRVDLVVVATDEELIVWGGSDGRYHLGDGAAYSFRDGTWRVLTASPLAPRSLAVAVWTGEEVLVWGGLGKEGPLFDGAAYDPSTDTWRMLPGHSFGAADGQPTASAWTGSAWVLTGVVSPPAGLLASDTFALDPSTGTWRALDPAPRPPDGADVRDTAVVWTGTEVLAVGIADGHDVWVDRLDVATGEWGERIITPAAGLDTGPEGVAWADDRLVITGHYAPGAVVDLASGDVTTLVASSSGLRFPAVALDDIVVVGDRWLDVDAGTWHDTGEVPGPVREFPDAVGHDGFYYVWGGNSCGPTASCGGPIDPGVGLRWSPPERP